jgi:4-amino-4-deoxy-L-arabinose transferase-like glycosyltransferase
MNLLNILANKKNIIYLVLITILYIILFCQNLGSYHFLDFFETKFTTIAKEMINNHSYFTPTLNGANNFDTPPLFFWLANIFCLLFGKITPEIVRLPNILCLYATAIFMFFSLKKLINEKYAFITVITFITNIAIIFFAHLASTDILFISTTPPLALFCCRYLFYAH